MFSRAPLRAASFCFCYVGRDLGRALHAQHSREAKCRGADRGRPYNFMPHARGKSRSLCRCGRVRRLSVIVRSRMHAAMTFDPQPILLEGEHVRLEPLTESHRAALHAAARGQDEVFRWFLTDSLAKPAEMDAWIDDALRAQASGVEVVWATVRRADNAVVGSTRFLDVRRPHRTLEIGNTWLARAAQRTAINTEAKYLQLRHAFEQLGAVRVQLKTDERNEPSRRAIARLGCTLEGILRNYQTRFDGYVRNTAMFSLTAAEWPATRSRLEVMLAR